MQLQVLPVTPFRQNCSLLWDDTTRHALVVDPGGDADVLMDIIRQRGLTVDAVLITHGHLDHAGGVAPLCRALAKEQGKAPVVIGPDKRDEFLLSSIAEQGRRFGLSDLEDATVDRYTQDGETLDLLGRAFLVLHVPGHTPGHVVFVDKAARFAFAGDTLFRGTVGRTDFPYGDSALLISTINEKLLPLGDDIVIMPGHGSSTTLGEERMNTPFLCAG
ncbi:MBL fold metallo-hydrolase [Acetobacter farinalis]|uniref:MBL fold metallo-hydrolase n=1 Tax=Acetobacter farinalis TaxID=1260984 RepID=A0ABT3Q8J6_9PROT|nr:MBL fold metallo-hydrolase [Acetobacter farinalis]